MGIDIPRVDSDSLRGFHRERRRPIAIGLSSIDWVAVKKFDSFKTGIAALGGLLSAGLVVLTVQYFRDYSREL